MTRNGNLPWEAVRQRVKISKLSMVQYNLNVIEAINCVYVRFINFEKKKQKECIKTQSFVLPSTPTAWKIGEFIDLFMWVMQTLSPNVQHKAYTLVILFLRKKLLFKKVICISLRVGRDLLTETNRVILQAFLCPADGFPIIKRMKQSSHCHSAG